MSSKLSRMIDSVSVEFLEQIHNETLAAVKDLHSSEARVIAKLQQVEQYLVHEWYECADIYQYAETVLELSKNQAYDFVSVANKCNKHPALQKAIFSGELSVSKARRILPVIDDGGAKEWVELAICETKEVVQKCVKLARQESQSQLEEAVEEDAAFDCVRRARDLLAQKLGRMPNQEELLICLAQDFVKRHDPVMKAQRALKRKASRQNQKAAKSADPLTFGPGQKSAQRTPLTAEVQHHLSLRDKRHCQFQLSNKQKCAKRVWVDTHHKIPRSQGGTDHPDNLTTLCKAHHRIVHLDIERKAPRRQ